MVDDLCGPQLGDAAAVKESSKPTLKTMPTFPSDWSALETAHLVINQGGKQDASGNICCAHAVIGQCQVQTEYQTGQKYFDFSNNRTRFEDAVSGEIIVNDYKKKMEMEVVHNATLGYDVCQDYCPLEDDLEVCGWWWLFRARGVRAVVVSLGRSREPVVRWCSLVCTVLPWSSMSCFRVLDFDVRVY
jgi:hypothetical protein